MSQTCTSESVTGRPCHNVATYRQWTSDGSSFSSRCASCAYGSYLEAIEAAAGDR